jgi:hypothetical protein
MQIARTEYVVTDGLTPDATSKAWLGRRDFLPNRDLICPGPRLPHILDPVRRAGAGAAVKTDNGRIKVADWLKMMENRTAKSADPDSALANYSFGWLWTELGISELRR